MIKRAFGTILIMMLATAAWAGVTPISDVKRGQSVTVEGVVERFVDSDEIVLRDDTGTLRVYLGERMISLGSGERIAIEGIMDDGLIMNELYARQITRENGEIIAISSTYD